MFFTSRRTIVASSTATTIPSRSRGRRSRSHRDDRRTGRGDRCCLGVAEACRGGQGEARTTAAGRDHAGRNPVGEIAWLKDAELLGILIPHQYGGGGASWADVAAVIQLIAEADSSIAHVLLYHYFGGLAGTRGENGFVGPERARRIAENQLLHGTIAQAAYPPLILATQTTDGFRLRGTKPFTSGAALGDVLLAWVVFDDGTELLGKDVSDQLATVHIDGGSARIDVRR